MHVFRSANAFFLFHLLTTPNPHFLPHFFLTNEWSRTRGGGLYLNILALAAITAGSSSGVSICTFILEKSSKLRTFVPGGLGLLVCVGGGGIAYVSIRQHTSAYASIRQHTSAYVRFCTWGSWIARWRRRPCFSILPRYQHTPSIRQHTSAYVSIRQHAAVSTYSSL